MTACPEISLGLFSATTNLPDELAQPAYKAAKSPDSNHPDHKSVLLAHVIATLTTSEDITDASMEIPSTFPSHPDYKKENAASAPASQTTPCAVSNANSSAETQRPIETGDQPPPVPEKDTDKIIIASAGINNEALNWNDFNQFFST